MRSLVLAFVLLGSPTAAAQPASPYLSIVDQYAAGDENGALNRIAGEGGRLPSAILAQMKTASDRQLRSAVMIHTELAAVFLAHAKRGDAIAQIGHAERLLAYLTENAQRRTADKSFVVHWYAFAANLCAAQGLLDPALRIVRAGLSVYDAPELYVARGAVFEMGRNFTAAVMEFERALAIDPSLASAHLHRGWVHFLRRDNRASSELDAALRSASTDSVRYLAHLFLGAVAERRGDLTAAHQQFEAAHQLGPYQTSAVALGRVEAEMGHVDRARAITAAYAQLPDRVEDPWWNYQLGGFEPDAITLLRAEARRP